MKYYAFVGAAALVLSACSSKPIAPAETATPQPAAPSAPAQPSAPKAASTAVQAPQAVPAHLDANSPISKERSVYFDYDQYVVKDQYRGTVEAHAKYLSDNRKLKIKIEGNADERGSREYNLALGQKRADAVKRAMTAQGVSDNQIETISFGEEKPKATGQTEEAYAQNRRADINYEGAGK